MASNDILLYTITDDNKTVYNTFIEKNVLVKTIIALSIISLFTIIFLILMIIHFYKASKEATECEKMHHQKEGFLFLVLMETFLVISGIIVYLTPLK